MSIIMMYFCIILYWWLVVLHIAWLATKNSQYDVENGLQVDDLKQQEKYRLDQFFFSSS